MKRVYDKFKFAYVLTNYRKKHHLSTIIGKKRLKII